jgi:beta-glucanase (GH16 family)
VFHTYGCLWTPDKVVWYFDNKPVTTVSTGPGTPFTAIEKEHMFIMLGTGRNWPMDVDYVHVWQ